MTSKDGRQRAESDSRGGGTVSISTLDRAPGGDLYGQRHGAPTLTYNWEVVDGGGTPVAGDLDDGSSFNWASAPSAQPGTYTGR